MLCSSIVPELALSRPAHKPRILFADEPTGNLDAETSEKLVKLLFDLNELAGTTLVLVTHDLDLAAKTARIIKLKGGRLVSDELKDVGVGAVRETLAK